MVRIVLSEDQVEILARSTGPVRVVDRSGRDCGRLVPPDTTSISEPVDNTDVAVAMERMQTSQQGKGVFYSTTEVLEHLRALEQS
jgi:hypothetical protein